MRKIKKIQTKDQIAEVIKNNIISGKFESGQELYQEELTKVLGLSRTPIREALQVLEQDGFLERLSNRHMRVLPLTKENIFMNFMMVGKVITEIALIIIENNMDATQLIKIYEEYESAVNKGFLKLSQEKEMEFLISIPEIVDNPYLIQICDKLLNGFPIYVIKNNNTKIGENKDTIKDIIYCIKNNDSKSISISVDNYFKNLSKLVTENLSV